MPRIRAKTIAQHKAQTRAAILDAAEEALAGHDFGAVSLGVIADLAAIPRSTVYDYFGSREAVVAALIEERVPPLVNDWMALLNRGYRVTPVGSSDSHDVGRHFVGQGRTYIRCDDSDPGNY